MQRKATLLDNIIYIIIYIIILYITMWWVCLFAGYEAAAAYGYQQPVAQPYANGTAGAYQPAAAPMQVVYCESRIAVNPYHGTLHW